MPWITITQDNWQDYLVRSQDVDLADPQVDRMVWGENDGTGSSVPSSNFNSIMNCVAFNNSQSNLFGVSNVSAVRTTTVEFIQDAIPDGYHGQQQFVMNKEVRDDFGNIVPEGEFYGMTGGKKLTALSDSPLAITSDKESYYKVPDDSIEVMVPNPGLVAIQGGAAIITMDDTNGIIMDATATFKVEVFVEDPPEPPTPAPKNYVYEMEKGFSFDGKYIPHFVELNWFWGDNPVDFTGIQKIRIHGLTKGFVKLNVAVNGMETDNMDYQPYYSEPQRIDLPRNPYYVSPDYVPVTSTTDTAGRGLSIQMKFEGANQNILLPEPSHVIQVLVLQTSPPGTGARSQ